MSTSITNLLAKAREAEQRAHWYKTGEEKLFGALADALEAVTATLADAEQSACELQPDPVLVEDSWIPVAEWPKILGNFMRSSAEYANKWKEAELKLEAVTVPGENVEGQLAKESIVELILANFTFDDTVFANELAEMFVKFGLRLPVTVPGENERRLLIEILDDDLKYDIGEACPVFQVGMAADAILDAGFRLPVPVEREWGLSDSMLKTFPRPHFTSTEENVKTQQRRGHPAIKVVSRVVSRWRFVPREKVDTQ